MAVAPEMRFVVFTYRTPFYTRTTQRQQQRGIVSRNFERTNQNDKFKMTALHFGITTFQNNGMPPSC